MTTLWLLAFFPAATGCAVFEPSDSLEAEAASLSTPDIDAAIKAAKPGEPRRAARAQDPT